MVPQLRIELRYREYEARVIPLYDCGETLLSNSFETAFACDQQRIDRPSETDKTTKHLTSIVAQRCVKSAIV